MRRPRMPRPGGWFAVAALLAVGAFLLASGMGSSDAPPDHVLVASRLLPAGTVIGDEQSASSLALAPVAPGLGLAGLLRDASQARGRRLVAPVSPGEPITESSLGGADGTGPAPLAAGERAVPVPLRSAGGPSVAPVPGQRVDVMASDGEGLAGRTRVVVPGAEVLAVTGASGEEGPDASGVLLLRLSTAQALDVTRALDFAREVRVVSRPVDEP